MEDKEKEQSQEGEPILSHLESYIRDGVVPQFSTWFSLGNSGNKVFLSFYQPEFSFSRNQYPVEKIRNMRCVARIVLTPAGLKVLTDLLNESLHQTSNKGARDEKSL